MPHDELGAFIMAYTGDTEFVRKLRAKANKLGYILNQHGLFKNMSTGSKERIQGEKVAGVTEEEILKLLEEKWVPPEERIG